MAIYNHKPMSLWERREYAKQLRKEAADKIAEAERIEEGCRADEQIMTDKIKEVFERINFKCILKGNGDEQK